MIKEAITDTEILDCFDVMSQLRPHLKKNDFTKTVTHLKTEGYKLAYLKQDDTICAVAGYRIYSNLAFGKHMYIDDLVTLENSRSKGFGVKLLDWLRHEAKLQQCSYFTLDSATHRNQAHKFYFKHNLTIMAYHFVEKLT
jgi:GNAT superfamily N-acetyltransferase